MVAQYATDRNSTHPCHQLMQCPVCSRLPQVIAFSPDPAALALGVTVQQQPGPSGALAASLATIGLGGSGGDSAAGPAAGAAAALALSPAQQQHQLVAALHARVAKATAEVEELRRAVDLHRSRWGVKPACMGRCSLGWAGPTRQSLHKQGGSGAPSRHLFSWRCPGVAQARLPPVCRLGYAHRCHCRVLCTPTWTSHGAHSPPPPGPPPARPQPQPCLQAAPALWTSPTASSW